MTLGERARQERAKCIDKVTAEQKKRITDCVIRAAKEGKSHILLSELTDDETRLINLWLISEDLNTEIRNYSHGYNTIAVRW